MDTKVCQVCGRLIVRDPKRHTRWARVQFCSPACRGAAKRTRVGRLCRGCGEAFIPRHVTSTSCSRECADRSRKVTQPTVTGRARARARYPATACSVDGEHQGQLERHHRDGNPMNNEPENIAVLCRRHHLGAHDSMRDLRIGKPWGGPRPRIVALLHERARAASSNARGRLAAGATIAEVAAEMGVDQSSVYRWLRKYPKE